MIRWLTANPALIQQYYSEILHIIYRILFLLFAEQRGMLSHAGAPELGVFGYDGMLFAERQTALIGERALENGALLRAIRALTLIERDGVLRGGRRPTHSPPRAMGRGS